MIGRVLILLALVLWMPSRALAQTAPDMFKDVPRDHWTYQAVDSLRVKGILIGYPDSYFRGTRTLTRYELAVALDRALQRAIGAPQDSARASLPNAQPGTIVHQQETGRPRFPGLTAEDLESIRRLISEFRVELASLGNNIQAVNRKVDQLARQLSDAASAMETIPRLSAGSLKGIRSGIGIGNMDQAARLNPSRFREWPLHDLRLGLASNLAETSTLSAALNNGGQSHLLGGSFDAIYSRSPGLRFGTVASQYAGSLNSAVPLNTYLNLLELRAPFRGIGRGSNLTIGRFNQQLGRLTLGPADGDSSPGQLWQGDGNLRIDGARLATNFGSLAFEAFGGQANSIGSRTNLPINSSLAAGSADSDQTPILSQPNTEAGTRSTNQLAGVSVGVGVRQLEGGHVRLSALEFAGAGRAGYNGIHALGADVSLRLTDRLSLLGDWGKTIAHSGPSETANPQFNSAFNAAVRYDAGSLNLTAGYRFVDPYFYAPAYWGRIGGWLNPTNIAGPTVRAAWDISPRFAINVGGEMFSAARDRVSRGGLGENDTITRALVGIRWNLSRSLETTLDWEGVYWDLQGANGLSGGTNSGLYMPGAGRLSPTEQYFTLGTGYSLTNNARLRLLYQVGTYDGKGLLLSGSGLGARNTFNLFTGQVAVRF